MAIGGDGTSRHRQGFRLGALAPAVEERLARFAAEDFGRRLWRKDPTLWSAQPVPELAATRRSLAWWTAP